MYLKVPFSVHWASSPPQIECSSRLIWHQTLDRRAPFHSKRIRRTRDPADARSGGRAIRRTRDPADARSGGRTILLSYFGVNQRCQICVSRNGNHVLLRILKNPSAIQLFHYRLLLFPLQLHIVSQVSIAAKWNKFFLIEATFLLDWP